MTWLFSLLLLSLLAAQSPAQNLYEPKQDPAAESRPADAAPSLESMSLLFVKPPDPRVFKQHDLVTIIIDETTKASADQKVETEKETKSDVNVSALVDPWALLELQLRQGNLSSTDLLKLKTKREFSGDGKYDRSDRLNARITATVVEVKPNGTILLEARKHIQKDEEIQSLLLAGVVRQDDITDRNTILSSQIADLTLQLINEGEVRDATKKGLITRVLDSIFAF